MNKASLPPIAITMGDPAGCGPAITIQAWQALKDDPAVNVYVVGDPTVFDGILPIREISDPAEAITSDAMSIYPIGEQARTGPGHPDASNAPLIVNSIQTATAHALSGKASAVVTNPINKALLYGAGFSHPGHTEFLAHLCTPSGGNLPRPVMMLVGGGLKVALATIHMPLRDVPSALSTESLIELGEITHAALVRNFGFAAPRLAFTGLNPHAGEDGTIGLEERDIINPAAEALRDSGIDISDARPGDTVFAEALAGQFDGVIAMTHDQGLIPVKTLDFWGGVNVTLGLPIIRTSPDHGTAYDAAANGTTRADSLIAAIKLAAELASNRAAP